MLGESGVEVLVQLAGRIVGDVEQLHLGRCGDRRQQQDQQQRDRHAVAKDVVDDGVARRQHLRIPDADRADEHGIAVGIGPVAELRHVGDLVVVGAVRALPGDPVVANQVGLQPGVLRGGTETLIGVLEDELTAVTGGGDIAVCVDDQADPLLEGAQGLGAVEVEAARRAVVTAADEETGSVADPGVGRDRRDRLGGVAGEHLDLDAFVAEEGDGRACLVAELLGAAIERLDRPLRQDVGELLGQLLQRGVVGRTGQAAEDSVALSVRHGHRRGLPPWRLRAARLEPPRRTQRVERWRHAGAGSRRGHRSRNRRCRRRRSQRPLDDPHPQ